MFPFRATGAFGLLFFILSVIAIVLNLALLGGCIWVVVEVLRWTGVIG